MKRVMFIVLLIGISASCLFYIKHSVKGLARDLMDINRQIVSDKEAIHVLNAEWAYLNQPARLKTFVKQYLQLDHIVAKQVEDESGQLLATSSSQERQHYSVNIIPTLKPILSSARRYE